MGKDYKKMLDSEVEWLHKTDSTDFRAEQEYRDRGLDELEEEEHYDYYSGGGEAGLIGFVLLLILLAVGTVVGVYISLYTVGVARSNAFFVIVIFLASYYFMFRKQGYSRFFNFLFFIGCGGLFTLLFPILFSGIALRGLTFEQYMAEPTIDFIEMIKFSFFYALFMVASYFFAKFVTSRNRKKSLAYVQSHHYKRRM